MNDKILNDVIAKNLRKLRKAKKLTQEELIEKIGEEKISLRSYKTYESGKGDYVPSLEKLIILSNFYNCSLDYLVFNKNSIYDDSFSKKDCLKRLVGLLFSFSLIYQDKDEDGNSIFVSYDDDVKMIAEKIRLYCLHKNSKFNLKNLDVYSDMLNDWYDLINEIEDLDEDFSPSIGRHNQLLLKNNIDPKKYMNDKIQNLERKTQIAEQRKGNK